MDYLFSMTDAGYIHTDFIGLTNTLLKEHKITVGERQTFLSCKKVELYSNVDKIEEMITQISTEIVEIFSEQLNTSPGGMASFLLSQRKFQLEDQLPKLKETREKLNSEISDILSEQQNGT